MGCRAGEGCRGRVTEPIRHCIRCGAVLTACMGFQLARDTLAAWDGLIPWSQVREHCGPLRSGDG